LNELLGPRVWVAESMIYVRIVVCLQSDALPDIARHGLIWVKPREIDQFYRYICARMLPKPPLKETVTIMFGCVLMSWLIARYLLCQKLHGKHLPGVPLWRKLHKPQIGDLIHQIAMRA
jgi:hypothetical protein